MVMISITDLNDFLNSDLVRRLIKEYDESLPLFRTTALKIYNDVSDYNEGLGHFTSIRTRIKSKNSLFLKIHKDLRKENKEKTQVSEEAVREAHDNIKDIVGLRVACQYLSEIKQLADLVFWDFLVQKGYKDLRASPTRDGNKFKEKDYIKGPEESTGYRGFHLFLGVPTEVDIFGKTQVNPCEVQIRTELQHIWSSRSHDLVFKPGGEETSQDKIEEMKDYGTHLYLADRFLERIKNELEQD